jgi:hypothetical protein
VINLAKKLMNPYKITVPMSGLVDQFLELKKQRLQDSLQAFHESKPPIQQDAFHSRRRSQSTIRYLQLLEKQKEVAPVQNRVIPNRIQITAGLPIPVPIQFNRFQSTKRPATTTMLTKQHKSEQKFEEITRSISELLSERPVVYQKITRDACTMTSGGIIPEEELKSIIGARKKQENRSKFIQTDNNEPMGIPSITFHAGIFCLTSHSNTSN